MNGSLNLGQFANLNNESTQASQPQYCAWNHSRTPLFPPATRSAGGILPAHIDVRPTHTNHPHPPTPTPTPGEAAGSRKIALDRRSPLVPPEVQRALAAS